MQHRPLIAAGFLLLGCFSDTSLDGRPCPCADGWVCCKVENVCIRPGSPCAVGIEPKAAQLRLGGSQQFVATNRVEWSIDETGGGSIDTQGVYRAPVRPGTYHVRATAPGGASATVTVIVGPTELVRALGYPGGLGSADGIGQRARLGRAGSIVGDASYLYVIDEPEGEPRLDPLPVGAPVTEQPAPGPRGVRRIDRSTGEVAWLVDDMPLRGLAIADSKLFAGVRESNGLDSAVRQIEQIHPGSGRSFGAVWAPLQDGCAWNANCTAADDDPVAGFRNIAGLASDGAESLYVTDTEPNCQYTALRRVGLYGDVKTLAAGATWPGWTYGLAPALAPFKCLGAVMFHEGRLYAVDRGGIEAKIWTFDPSTGSVEEMSGLPSSTGLLAFCFDDAGKVVGISGGSGEASVSGPSSKEPLGPVSSAPGILCNGKWSPSGNPLSGQSSPATGQFFATSFGAVVRIDRGKNEVKDLAGKRRDAGPNMCFPVSSCAFLPPGPDMLLDNPSGVSSDASGNLVVFDGGKRFVRVSASGEVSALGCGPSPGGGRRNLSAQSPDGDLYFMDGSALKKLDAATGECAVLQNIEVAAGPGAVRIDLVHDGLGTLYLSSFDPPNRRVIRIDAKSGAYETLLAGRSGFLATNGEKQLFVAELGDASQGCASVISRIGLADLEPQAVPSSDSDWCASALAYDPVGVLYVAEASRNRVRALSVETGEVVDLVGSPGHEAVWLEKLPASLNRPIDIALLPDGALAIADFDEHVILLAR